MTTANWRVGAKLQQQCVDCPSDTPPLHEDEIELYKSRVPNWNVVEDESILHLRRDYTFDNFSQALLFAVRVGELADLQGHHPRLVIEPKRVRVDWWTAAIGGLHQNDFIMATNADDLYERWEIISGQKDSVEVASEESFPASDPPARSST
jgi:4a-hydroxytetrahydrobiopterin dehydratase